MLVWIDMYEEISCLIRNFMSCLCVHVYLLVEAPEAAADDTTPRLVMDSIKPPYTILFKMSSSVCKTFWAETTIYFHKIFGAFSEIKILIGFTISSGGGAGLISTSRLGGGDGFKSFFWLSGPEKNEGNKVWSHHYDTKLENWDKNVWSNTFDIWFRFRNDFFNQRWIVVILSKKWKRKSVKMTELIVSPRRIIL